MMVLSRKAEFCCLPSFDDQAAIGMAEDYFTTVVIKYRLLQFRAATGN